MHDNIIITPYRPELVDSVLSKIYRFDPNKFYDWSIFTNWCLENIGEDRYSSPLAEAKEGWIDYIEGDWALDSDNESAFIWFLRKQDLMKFQMVWG